MAAAGSAVSATDGVATDQRSIGVQVSDTEIEAKIKAGRDIELEAKVKTALSPPSP